MNPAAPVAATLPPITGPLLESLYQHRVLRTRQLHAMHAPHAGVRWTQHVLAQLAAAGLVAFVRAGRGGARLYHLTPHGADAVELIPTRAEPRRRIITAAKAAGPLQAHTLAVNDVGIAFMTAARERGDDCGALAWRHEIAHPIGPARGARHTPLLIADALISYLHEADLQLTFHYAFLELDRATAPTDTLAAKLARYAALYRYTPRGADRPAWREHYPVFPRVLCLLAGQGRGALERRAQTVLALCAADPLLTTTPAVQIALCHLDDLTTHGPFAAICLRPQHPDTPVNWLGEPA